MKPGEICWIIEGALLMGDKNTRASKGECMCGLGLAEEDSQDIMVIDSAGVRYRVALACAS